MGASGYMVGEHTVNACSRHDEGQCSEYTDNSGIELPAGELGIKDLIHGADLRDRQSGIDVIDHLTYSRKDLVEVEFLVDWV